VPSVGHFRQGMLVSIPLFLDKLKGQPTPREIIQIYDKSYGTSARVLVNHDSGIQDLAPQAKNNTDILEIHVCANEQYGHVLLVAQLDNLGKGASGAAVQNIALMLGLPDPNLRIRELVHA
jgi:N-acetyl-gamma-glutamyl-phosphate reductase